MLPTRSFVGAKPLAFPLAIASTGQSASGERESQAWGGKGTMGKTAVFIVLLAALSGCGLAKRNEARATYDKSREAYKACLASQATSCERQRLAMEADRQAFKNIWSGDNDAVVIVAPR